MTEPTRLTPGEMRSNAQAISDRYVKERVLRGIEVLTEKFGPDWVDNVDLDDLDLGLGAACVLGQVYRSVEPTAEQWETYSSLTSNEGPIEDADGYERGLAILDGDVMESPASFGFDAQEETYSDLTEAWRMALRTDA